MQPDDIAKTVIATPFSLFEFLRIPFGLCNAAQTFQRFIYEVLCSLDFVYAYIDDLLIASSSEAVERIRKESFASANSRCFSFNGENVEDVENSRICTSIWVYKQEKGAFVGHNSQNHAGFKLLLLLAGIIETCIHSYN